MTKSDFYKAAGYIMFLMIATFPASVIFIKLLNAVMGSIRL